MQRVYLNTILSPLLILFIYIAQLKITPDASMLARLFTNNSKRDILKDEVKAVKNLPQYILNKTIYAHKENALDLIQFVAPIKPSLPTYSILLRQITYPI